MGLPTTKYSAQVNLDGSSIFLGFQFNASYALSEMFSVSAGFRFISAKNTYKGGITNIMVNPYVPPLGLTGQMMPASTLFGLLGQPAYAALTANKSVDAEQTGTGFTPILGFMATPIEGLVLTLRYEFNTALELTNKTVKDDTGLFPDGVKSNNDIPAILAFGASYAILPELRAHFSYTQTFDKNANWDGRELLVDKNGNDMAFGLEYDLSSSLTVSAGYQKTSYNFLTGYQTDLAHDLPADTIGAGLKWKMNDQLSFDLGLISVKYTTDNKTIPYVLNTPLGALPLGSFGEHYKESTFAVGIGINYSFK
jgi:long-chain fatty acid transport protein